MAAGLGFKDFQTGEVLTAADVDGYLMQGIWVFADATARDAAVTSPQEGNACYLKDTNEVLTYSGSAWVAVGGGSPLTTKGDLFGFSTVDARIPIGANNTVLTADSAETLGLKWATPSTGGMTLISETVLSSATGLSLSGISGSYKQLVLVYSGVLHSGSGSAFGLRFNNDSTATAYESQGLRVRNTTIDLAADQQSSISSGFSSANYIYAFGENANNGGLLRTASEGYLVIDNYASTTKYKQVFGSFQYYNTSAGVYVDSHAWYMWANTSAITSLDVVRLTGSATISNTANTCVRLYGVA